MRAQIPNQPHLPNQLKWALGTIGGLATVGALSTLRFATNLTAQVIAWSVDDDAEKNWAPTMFALAFVTYATYKLAQLCFLAPARPLSHHTIFQLPQTPLPGSPSLESRDSSRQDVGSRSTSPAEHKETQPPSPTSSILADALKEDRALDRLLDDAYNESVNKAASGPTL